MYTFKFLCLANSLKLGGRCIAGLKTDGSGWLRPVSSLKSGTLQPKHYKLPNNAKPELLSILEVKCSAYRPHPHKRENWLLGCYRWKSLGFPSRQQINKIFRQEKRKSEQYSDLLGNRLDRVPWSDVLENRVKRSLSLVWPREIVWKLKTWNHQRAFRAEFSWQGERYDLSITDPIWREKLGQLKDGDYDSQTLSALLKIHGPDAARFIFTISLGDPFLRSTTGDDEPSCYKLISAVINIELGRTRLGLSQFRSAAPKSTTRLQ